jgi:hypothetical protein
MKLTVGCPVRDRAWIIGDWYDHVDRACTEAQFEDFNLVVIGAQGDTTFSTLVARSTRDVHIIYSGEVASPDERDWQQPGRYDHMAALRNRLLRKVRQLQPDLYLSVDSDVLLHPQALVDMLGLLATGKYGAVGSKTYLSDRSRIPNYASFAAGGLFRPDANGRFPVAVLMAIKLMTPDAYAVDYAGDPLGEDIAWSKAARRAGVRLGWSGVTTSRHVWSRDQLTAEAETNVAAP